MGTEYEAIQHVRYFELILEHIVFICHEAHVSARVRVLNDLKIWLHVIQSFSACIMPSVVQCIPVKKHGTSSSLLKDLKISKGQLRLNNNLENLYPL